MRARDHPAVRVVHRHQGLAVIDVVENILKTAHRHNLETFEAYGLLQSAIQQNVAWTNHTVACRIAMPWSVFCVDHDRITRLRPNPHL